MPQDGQVERTPCIKRKRIPPVEKHSFVCQLNCHSLLSDEVRSHFGASCVYSFGIRCSESWPESRLQRLQSASCHPTRGRGERQGPNRRPCCSHPKSWKERLGCRGCASRHRSTERSGDGQHSHQRRCWSCLEGGRPSTNLCWYGHFDRTFRCANLSQYHPSHGLRRITHMQTISSSCAISKQDTPATRQSSLWAHQSRAEL